MYRGADLTSMGSDFGYVSATGPEGCRGQAQDVSPFCSGFGSFQAIGSSRTPGGLVVTLFSDFPQVLQTQESAGTSGRSASRA